MATGEITIEVRMHTSLLWAQIAVLSWCGRWVSTGIALWMIDRLRCVTPTSYRRGGVLHCWPVLWPGRR